MASEDFFYFQALGKLGAKKCGSQMSKIGAHMLSHKLSPLNISPLNLSFRILAGMIFLGKPLVFGQTG